MYFSLRLGYYFFPVLFLPVFLACLPSWASVEGPKSESTEATAQIEDLITEAKAILFTQPDSAFLRANRALQLAQKGQYALGIADSHEIIGTVYFYQGVYSEALSHLLEAEKRYKGAGQLAKMAENLNQQGLVYFNIRQPQIALARHQEALRLYEQLTDSQGIAYSYGCLGHLYEKKQEYAVSLDYQRKALDYYERIDDKQGLGTILENIGSIYEDQANYPLALDHFNRALVLNGLTGDSLSMIVNLNNIGDIYRKTNVHTQALAYTQRALALATRLNDRDQINSAYIDLGKIYNQMGEYEKAYENLEVGRNMYKEIYAAESSRQLHLLQTLFGIERKNSEINALESQQRLDRFIKIALGAGLALIVLLGIIIISRQRLKLIKNNQIMAQNQQVFEAQNKLIHAELENGQLRERQLQHELEARSKSLTAHTLHIIGKNKILEEIQQKLTESLAEEPQSQRKKLKNLVKMIDYNFVQDKDWEDFRHIFEQVHQDFFEKLQSKYPELTSADVRLAALIKLNLPSKDMATTLGISGDSIRIARYRLKKKLGLDVNESLTNFIQGV